MYAFFLKFVFSPGAPLYSNLAVLILKIQPFLVQTIPVVFWICGIWYSTAQAHISLFFAL